MRGDRSRCGGQKLHLRQIVTVRIIAASSAAALHGLCLLQEEPVEALFAEGRPTAGGRPLVLLVAAAAPYCQLEGRRGVAEVQTAERLRITPRHPTRSSRLSGGTVTAALSACRLPSSTADGSAAGPVVRRIPWRLQVRRQNRSETATSGECAAPRHLEDLQRRDLLVDARGHEAHPRLHRGQHPVAAAVHLTLVVPALHP